MSLFDQLNQSGSPISPQGGGMAERQRFVEYIKLQAYADHYIDRQEEYKILEKGIDLGIDMEQGRKVLAETTEQMGWVLESVIEDRAAEQLAAFAVANKRVDKKGFMQIAAQLSQASKGYIKPEAAKVRLKQILLDKDVAYREGGLFGSEWLSEIGGDK